MDTELIKYQHVYNLIDRMKFHAEFIVEGIKLFLLLDVSLLGSCSHRVVDHTTASLFWLQSLSLWLELGINTTQKMAPQLSIILIWLLFYCCSNQLSSFYCTVAKCFSFEHLGFHLFITHLQDFLPLAICWRNSRSVGACLL